MEAQGVPLSVLPGNFPCLRASVHSTLATGWSALRSRDAGREARRSYVNSPAGGVRGRAVPGCSRLRAQGAVFVV